MASYPNLKDLIGYRLFTGANPVSVYHGRNDKPFKKIPKGSLIGVLKSYWVDPKTKKTWLTFYDPKNKEAKDYFFPWITNKSDFDWTRIPAKKSAWDNVVDVLSLPFVPGNSSASLELTKEGVKHAPGAIKQAASDAANYVEDSVKSVASGALNLIAPYAIGAMLLAVVVKNVMNKKRA